MAAVAIVPRGQVSGITVMANPEVGARSVPLDFADPEEAVAVEVSLGRPAGGGAGAASQRRRPPGRVPRGVTRSSPPPGAGWHGR